MVGCTIERYSHWLRETCALELSLALNLYNGVVERLSSFEEPSEMIGQLENGGRAYELLTNLLQASLIIGADCIETEDAQARDHRRFREIITKPLSHGRSQPPEAHDFAR